MSSHDISIGFYEPKLELMVIFQFWYSPKGKREGKHFSDLQKLLLVDVTFSLFVSGKTFLLITSTLHVCLQVALASYLSEKTSHVISRHLNRILRAKTWADGDFSVLMLPQEQNWLRTFQSDICGELIWFLHFLLKNGLENFLEVLE